jgi:hypothetical protein
VSEPFDGRHVRNRPSFHGRVSTNRLDKGFQNYLNLMMDGYQIRVILNGVERSAKTISADPDAGTIEIIHTGTKPLVLKGNVEIKLERDKDKPAKGRMTSSRR